MKHIKLFENQNQTYYLFDYFIVDEDKHNYKLFPDLESCELFFLDIVNEERKMLEEDNYNESMFFTNVKDAAKWYYDNFKDIQIGWDRVEIEKKYVPTEDLRLKLDTNKYNL